LSVPGFSQNGPAFLKKPFFWIAIVALGVYGFFWFNEGGHKQNVDRSKSSPYAKKINRPAKPVFNADPVFISHGIIQKSHQRGLAPLSIKTSDGSNYYVKLVDLTGNIVLSFYIVGGQYFKTKVPLGNFELRYASGKVWYGFQHLFGPETVYAKTDSDFEFRSDGNRYIGYTVELIRQVGGNLRTRRISPANF